MGLADDLSQPDSPWAQPCGVTKVLERLDKADADALRRALADPGLTAAFIARKLKDNDFHVGADTIRRHRRGACRGDGE